jgi:hypothetical protein
VILFALAMFLRKTRRIQTLHKGLAAIIGVSCILITFGLAFIPPLVQIVQQDADHDLDGPASFSISTWLFAVFVILIVVPLFMFIFWGLKCCFPGQGGDIIEPWRLIGDDIDSNNNLQELLSESQTENDLN